MVLYVGEWLASRRGRFSHGEKFLVPIYLGLTVQESNSGGGEIFRTRPDGPWGPLSLLHNGYGFLAQG
jgi:hypothetical protein